MMVPLEDALLGAGITAGLLLCLLGVYAYRTWDEPGVGAFAAFVAVLGLGGVVAGLVGLVVPEATDPDGPALPLWGQLAFLFWGLSAVPWFVFSLRYTGRTRVRWRTTGILFLPFGGIALDMALAALDLWSLLLESLIVTAVLIYCLALVIIGAALILRTAHQYGHLSLGAESFLVAGPVVLFFFLNSQNVFAPGSTAASGLYAGGFAFTVLSLGLTLIRYDVLGSTPAVGAIGERTITEQIDDLVVVVDDHERIIECNETVTETLDVPRSAILGEPLDTLLAYDVDGLRERESIALDTVDGNRQYDSQVSTITDQHDRDLGSLISLHDVTEHEIREQRLAVLNRVLRHNLRNKVEVVKSHAEVLEDRHQNDHAATIAETADKIATLGHSARTIDQFVSNSNTSTEVDLGEAIERVSSAVGPKRDEVDLSLDLPESASVETNAEALTGALESTLDNALTYADSAVRVRVEQRPDEYEISIADDGPGIPESELGCLDAGTETALEHGTGLGLWQLKWAVTTMGGDLAFDTSDGTTVTFTVPTGDARITDSLP